MRRTGLVIGLLLASGLTVRADELAPSPRPFIDLTGYRSVAEAVQADAKLVRATSTPLAVGYLGVQIGTDASGAVVVEEVADGSPAGEAGFIGLGSMIRTAISCTIAGSKCQTQPTPI